jgi:tetratricopeptide (TPR) repeat protein
MPFLIRRYRMSAKNKIEQINTSYEKALQEVLSLTKAKCYRQAVEKIYDTRLRRLKTIFKTDINHSWYVLGDIYLRFGEYENALQAFKRALRNWPDDAQAMWAIADCYSAMNKLKLAERYYRHARGGDAATSELTYNIANSLFDQGRYKEAIIEYKAIGRVPDKLRSLVSRNLKLATKLASC